MNPGQVNRQLDDDRDTLKRRLNTEYYSKVRNSMAEIKFIEFTKDHGLPVIRVLVKPGGESLRTLSRTSEGYIMDSWAPDPAPSPETDHDGPPLFARYDEHINALKEDLVNHFTALAIEDLGIERYARLCLPEHRAGAVHMRNNAADILRTTAAQCATPRGTRRIPPRKLYSETNRLIRSQLMRPESREIAEKITSLPNNISAHQYNLVHSGGRAFAVLAYQDLTLARFYLRNLMRLSDPPPNRTTVLNTIQTRWGTTHQEAEVIAAICRDAHVYTHSGSNGAKDYALPIARTIIALNLSPDSDDARVVRAHTKPIVGVLNARPEATQHWLSILPDLIARTIVHTQHVTRARQQYSRRREPPGMHPTPIEATAAELIGTPAGHATLELNP